MRELLKMWEEQAKEALKESQPTNIFAYSMHGDHCDCNHVIYAYRDDGSGMPMLYYAASFIRPDERDRIGEDGSLPTPSDGPKDLKPGMGWTVRLGQSDTEPSAVKARFLEVIAQLKAA